MDKNFQELVLTLLKDLKEDFKEDLRNIRDEIKNIRDEIKDVRADQREDRKLLMDLWETRKQTEYKITKDFIFKNLAWNAVVIIIGLALGKIFLL